MTGSGPDERLLRALAEELKLPLLQIARQTELEGFTDRGSAPQADLNQIGDTARMALKLLDGFLLGSQLQALENVPMEPVSLSSALTEAAHRLEPLARRNNCDIVVSLGGKYSPAMANRQSLDSALLLLGYSVIEGWSGEGEPGRHEVILGAHRSASGLVAGVFDNRPGLNADVLRRGRALAGSVRQTMPAISSDSGAGVFVADSLLRSMSAPLHAARHHKRSGLAATFHPSKQLSLV